MTNDGAINRLLYAILSQKCLKDIDWNKVAHDPVLSQEITNGHAARMRYFRFKKQMDGTTSMPTGPRKIATPRRSRVEKKKPAKRELKFKNRKDSRQDVKLSSVTKSESQNDHTCPSTSTRATDMDSNNPLSTLKITNFEPTNSSTFHFKTKTESDLFLPFPITSSESSPLPTPFLMESPTSPNSPTFLNPGIFSLHSSILSTANLKNRMMDTSFFGPPLYKQTESMESVEAGRRDHMRYCFDPWNQVMDGFNNITGVVEDQGGVMFKREESCEDALYESFMK